jgi:hypothetical protein
MALFRQSDRDQPLYATDSIMFLSIAALRTETLGYRRNFLGFGLTSPSAPVP